MNRDIYSDLLVWQKSEFRKPLILRGARQTGKTYILQKFGKSEYQNCHYFNFESNPELSSLFSGNLNPSRLIKDLQIIGKREIHKVNDLIIFDEIQACNDALNSLKYFNEQSNEYHIAAAGSLLGIQMSRPNSFPVGKVDFLDLHPMTFYEFLSAGGEGRYREYLESIETIEPLPEAFHNELIELLITYYHVGGMPEVVSRYFGGAGGDACRRIQETILDSYKLDFAKHAPSSDIPKLSLIWESIPAQLSRENKKFIFSLLKKGARAREYENALTWLINAGLIHRSRLTPTPKLPLKAYVDASSFKIYVVDIGLLGALANAPTEVTRGDASILMEYHGAFVENYTAQQLKAMFGQDLYYWKNVGRAAELDFIIQDTSTILPMEVKAGTSIRSKSLAFYTQKFEPIYSIRTSLRNLKVDGNFINIPHYLLQSMPRILSLMKKNN